MTKGRFTSSSSLNKVVAKMQKLPNSIKTRTDAVLSAAAANMTNNAVNDVPINEGRLKSSISFEKIKDMDYEVSAGVFYAPYVEWGTKSKADVPAELQSYAEQFRGKAPQEGDFYKFALAILDWMKKKGITAGQYSVTTKRRLGNKAQKFDEDVKLAESIAYSILKKGIKPHPFFFKNYYPAESQALKDLKQVIKDALND